ncbi:DUF3298 and DUF4163 domain-containing protein [Thermotoga sp.]|uniref:DUF3298 and DUF4163 domain-containing protein n=1 Tax=Thermotoga sp. TaxID=28240 RepID=UPI0025F0DA94|nr:DUF3298 and DUF4163 domain-containing protein [Thermotoga sp.]MCD6552140.1 DUF3298 and DUF4163 domain-containing protein [Thermotoga sp.]
MKSFLFPLLLSCLFFSVSIASDIPEIEVVKIVKDDYGEDTMMGKSSIEIPRFKNLGNIWFEMLLNYEVEKSAKEFVEYIELWAREARKQIEEMKDKDEELYKANLMLKYIADVSHEIRYVSPRYLSFILYYYRYTGGAHGMTYCETFNIDLVNYRKLRYEDVFKPEAEKVIKKEILRYMFEHPDPFFIPTDREFSDEFFEELYRKYKEEGKSYREEQIEKVQKDETLSEKDKKMLIMVLSMCSSAIDTVLKDDLSERPFLITKEGLVVKYMPYEVGPYVSGLPEVLIPWERLKDVMKIETPE